MLALIRSPGQWQRIRADPTVLDTAVEEILRWTTPATYVGRAVRERTVVHGVELVPGDVVTLWNISANRDEDAFAELRRFAVDRTPNRHVTFGSGPHVCVGGRLARMELRALLDVLRCEVSGMSLAGEVEYATTSFLTGVSALPVTLTG